MADIREIEHRYNRRELASPAKIKKQIDHAHVLAGEPGTAEAESKISPVVMALIDKHQIDPEVAPIAADLIDELKLKGAHERKFINSLRKLIHRCTAPVVARFLAADIVDLDGKLRYRPLHNKKNGEKKKERKQKRKAEKRKKDNIIFIK